MCFSIVWNKTIKTRWHPVQNILSYYCKSCRSCYFMVWFWLREAKWGWENKIYTVTDNEVSVKRIFDICVDLHMIYMFRMHWPFLIEFCVVLCFKRWKKHWRWWINNWECPSIRSSPKPLCSLMATTFLPEKGLKSKKSLLQSPNFDHRNSLSKNKHIIVLLKTFCGWSCCLSTLGWVVYL